MINQSNTERQKLNKPILVVAIGMTLAMLPSIIGAFIGPFKPDLDINACLIAFIAQAAGSLTMLIGFSIAYSQLSLNSKQKAGFIIAIVASILGLGANLVFSIVNHEDRWIILELDQGNALPIILIIVFLLLSPLMTIACAKLDKIFYSFRKVWIAFAALSLVMIASYGIWGVSDHACSETKLNNMLENSYYSYDSGYGHSHKLLPRGLDIITYIGMFAALGSTLTFVWCASGGRLRPGIKLKKKESAIPADMITVSSHVNDNSQYMQQGYMPVNKPTSPEQQPVTTQQPAVHEDVIKQLMSLDNPELKAIVDRPAFYNPAIVEKAHELLNRRKAWERINNLTDDELIKITMDSTSFYNINIVEAASMELHQRGSDALRRQFMALTPDVVAAIADGTTPAPEGIRLAAKDFLDKHLRR